MATASVTGMGMPCLVVAASPEVARAMQLHLRRGPFSWPRALRPDELWVTTSFGFVRRRAIAARPRRRLPVSRLTPPASPAFASPDPDPYTGPSEKPACSTGVRPKGAFNG
ncbi:hypothetical protein Pen01_69800 [Phytomonospora endophytica]|nr:hypothetical protein Pen01_69800 [Phytomonospora endophytica]